MAIDQDITNLPTPPSRSDSPSDFSDKADAFLSALPQLQTELNLYADEANSTQTEINTSESNAATSEDNAQDWAIDLTGLVLSTDYSAKAYAISDSLIPEGAAKEWSLKTDGTVDTTEYSSKAYSISENLIPVGSSKEWAIKTGSTVDGVEFSAKKYAQDAESSASAAASTAGAVAWDSGVTYDTNDAAIGTDGNTYRSLVDNNIGNDPVTDGGSNWLNLTATLSDQEVRDLFSASGDLNYNSSTGVFEISVQNQVELISSNTTAEKDKLYVITADLTLTLPATPSIGDKVFFSNRSGLTTPVIDRNGENIMGISEDLTLDNEFSFGSLIYVDSNEGWIFS